MAEIGIHLHESVINRTAMHLSFAYGYAAASVSETVQEWKSVAIGWDWVLLVEQRRVELLASALRIGFSAKT